MDFNGKVHTKRSICTKTSVEKIAITFHGDQLMGLAMEHHIPF